MYIAITICGIFGISKISIYFFSRSWRHIMASVDLVYAVTLVHVKTRWNQQYNLLTGKKGKSPVQLEKYYVKHAWKQFTLGKYLVYFTWTVAIVLYIIRNMLVYMLLTACYFTSRSNICFSSAHWHLSKAKTVHITPRQIDNCWNRHIMLLSCNLTLKSRRNEDLIPICINAVHFIEPVYGGKFWLHIFMSNMLQLFMYAVGTCNWKTTEARLHSTAICRAHSTQVALNLVEV